MRTKHIIALLAVLTTFGCTKEQMLPPEAEPENKVIVFTGVSEKPDGGTRALPQAGGAVIWTEDERIGVYDGTNYVLATVEKVNGNAITFSAEVDANADTYIAVVPYEAALNENAFAQDGRVRMRSCTAVQKTGSQVCCIAGTRAGERTFRFRNVGNIIRFGLRKSGVTKATFRGNDGEKIAGTLTVNPLDGSCSAFEPEADCIAFPAAEGENFISVAPGITLEKGFTLTLYGDEGCTDYQGEVTGSKPLAMTSNEMKNLGIIDGWIDNYKLWQAGKSITVAGIEYSKQSTGFAGKLLCATEADHDLFDDLYGKSGTFFLEQSDGHKFTSRTFINIGSTAAAANVIIVSRYDNAPVTYKPAGQFNLLDGNFAAKGLNFEIKAAGYTPNQLFRTSNKTVFGNLHLDRCKYGTDSSAKQLVKFDHNAIHGIRSINITNSRIESTVNGMVQILFASPTYPFLDEIGEVIFNNNAIYNPNAGGRVQLFGTAGPTPSTGAQRTAFTIKNCTFYNMAPTTCLQSNSMGNLTVRNNLFYSEQTPEGSTIIAYSKDEKNEYAYEFENNFCGNFNNLYWFNPNSGIYKALKKTVEKTSKTMFTTADTGKGIFIQAPGFESCGANL